MKKVAAVLDIRGLDQAVKDLATKIGPLLGTKITDTTLISQIGNLLNRLTLKKDEIKKVVQTTFPSAQQVADTPEFWRKNLEYGETKEAHIRSNEDKQCPFGLSIPRACSEVGDAIYKMEPVIGKTEQVKEKYTASNRIIFTHCKERNQCPYADKILNDKFRKVDCDFGDYGEGMHGPNLQGSPIYPSTINYLDIHGLSGRELGYYNDNTPSRNMFYGLFSYLGKKEFIELIKISKNLDTSLKILGSKVK